MTELDYTRSNPGVHKTFKINRFEDRELQILNRLKNWWYLTNSGEDIVLGANARLSYFLMKPATSFAEMFNLEREIICVFSPYPNFESRSLDGYDRALNSFEKFRIESICWILISDDPNIEEKVQTLLKTDPETPIVIPFTYADLVDVPDEYVIRNRFRKHFFTRDLFAFLTPLKKDLYLSLIHI